MHRCLELVEAFAAQSSDDPILLEIAEEEIKILNRELKDAKSDIRKQLSEIDKLKKDQSAKEIYAYEAMTEKIKVAGEELNEYIARSVYFKCLVVSINYC